MNLTAIVINFLREPYLFKCLESLRTQYPDIKILVAENGKPSKRTQKKVESYGAVYVPIEFDAGICRARNTLVGLAGTDYVLIGDDDFFYNHNAGVDKMLAFLERHPEYALIGGRIFENEKIRDYQGYFDFVTDENGEGLVYRKLEMNDWLKDEIQYKECDLVFNYFVARKKDIIQWDNNIKVSYEHSTFFIDLKRAGKKVVFAPDCIVTHKPKLDKEYNFGEYAKYRYRKLDKQRFFNRNNIVWARDMNGNFDTL